MRVKKYLLMTAAVIVAVAGGLHYSFADAADAIAVTPSVTDNTISDNSSANDKSSTVRPIINSSLDNKTVINAAPDAKLTFKINIGYIYNFASKWNMDGTPLNGAANSAVGYGGSLGYSDKSGFGLSADYLSFNNKWNTDGIGYEASFSALTLTPSYGFSLDKDKWWALRVGLGVGFSLSDISWGNVSGSASAKNFVNSNRIDNNAAGKMAGGAVYAQHTSTDSPFTASICDNLSANRIVDSVGAGNATSKCFLVVGNTRTKVADINDIAIARWFVSDSKARLGIVGEANGATHIAYGVWSLLLKGADGNAAALSTLTPAGGTGVTQAQAKTALAQLMGGYDGATLPLAYQSYNDMSLSGNSIYVANHKADALGINASEANRLRAAGIRFMGDPAPAGTAKDDAGFCAGATGGIRI